MNKAIMLMVLLILAVGVIGARWLLNTNPDNMVEQAVEQAIKDQTGVDIDLSPDER